MEALDYIRQLLSIDPAAIYGLSAGALFFILAASTLVSEDAACIAAGGLAANGRIGFAVAVGACFLGIFVGDILLYWTGRIFGRRAIETRVFSGFVSADALSRASDWLNRRGASAIFLSRFVTGLRLPTYLAAGFFRTDFPKFALWFLLAAAIWTPLLVGAAAFSLNLFSQNALLGAFAAFAVIKLISKLISWKNRRLLVGRLKRVYKWEFWPVQIFYLPVFFYVLICAIKHRSLAVFTCANPAIPAGGFTGESKNEIYRGLGGSEYLPKYMLIEASRPADARLTRAQKFVIENALTFPVVLKPDAGERGRGVAIANSWDELKKGIEMAKTDHILQEYAGGVEASIFYYRYPNEKRGRIFSITEKKFPRVTGDGIADIETLILRDKRLVCLAKSYLEQNSSRLSHIPEKGERVKIIDIGTHSRGAIFLDGGWMRTPELEAAIDEICRGFEGFYFGRFDIRCASFEDLMRGENFRIIELNGVTSESTNIYDPRYSLLDAYRILFRQWLIAFEIGAVNNRLGARPSRVRDLIRLSVGKSVKERSKLIQGPLESV